MNQPDSSAAAGATRNRPFFKRPILRLIVPAVLGIALVGLYLHFEFSHSIGNGPAGPAIAAEGFARPWTTRPVVLVGLGDSVTAGFGARPGHGYFSLLGANPPDEFPGMRGVCLSAVIPHLRATNLAVSGSVSVEVLESQIPKLPNAGPDTLGLIVITTGGNDLIHNYGRTPPRESAMYGATLVEAESWIARFGERLAKVVNGLDQHFPGGCQIFLANIYDPTDGVGDIARAGLPAWPDGPKLLAAYNEVIRGCAARHPNVHLVDLHAAFLGHGIHCARPWARHYDSRDPHYWYYFNLEDPNERGYDAVRRLFLLEMFKVRTQFPP